MDILWDNTPMAAVVHDTPSYYANSYAIKPDGSIAVADFGILPYNTEAEARSAYDIYKANPDLYTIENGELVSKYETADSLEKLVLLAQPVSAAATDMTTGSADDYAPELKTAVEAAAFFNALTNIFSSGEGAIPSAAASSSGIVATPTAQIVSAPAAVPAAPTTNWTEKISALAMLILPLI